MNNVRPFDELLRSHDFNPQIIGNLGTSPSGVTIEIWNIANGDNELLDLIDNNCFQIGNTGRWRWSTVNLPRPIMAKNQYFFIMTSRFSNRFIYRFI